MMKLLLTIIMGVLLFSTTALAEVRTKMVPYKHGNLMLQGYFAWDDAIKGTRPGVLVVHEWWGLNDYVRGRAERLAAMGYVAFALDMYGKGRVTQHPDQAGTWMKQVQTDVNVWQGRALKGLDILQGHRLVDGNRLAAIGYCFGGSTVLQLVYSGARLKGVVSFHGALPLPRQNQPMRTDTKILIAHGNADPFVSEAHVKKFRSKLEATGLDWQMIVYSGARHAFTNPGADAHGIDALKYNKQADERSWRHMKLFFDEIFAVSQ